MGVDIGEAHWAYSGFNRFRRRLAAHEGFDLDAMLGYESHDRATDGLPWDRVTTPLRPLLDHSDCDGELTREECAQVAPRLREVLDEWARGNYPPGFEDRTEHDVRQGRLLLEAMEAVADGTADEDVLEFM